MKPNLTQRAIMALRLSPLTVKQMATMLNCCQHTIHGIMADLLESGMVWRDVSDAKTYGRHAYIFHLVQS